jgi:hypothetical protein
MFRRNWKIITLIAIALIATVAALIEYRRIGVLEDRLGCAATWLDRAKALHTAQMQQSETFTGDEMRKLMGSVDSAYDCATKEPSSGHPPGAGAFGQYGVLPQK